jgi:hypothetical protein
MKDTKVNILNSTLVSFVSWPSSEGIAPVRALKSVVGRDKVVFKLSET